MDSKSIGLCPQGVESPRCRICKLQFLCQIVKDMELFAIISVMIFHILAHSLRFLGAHVFSSIRPNSLQCSPILVHSPYYMRTFPSSCILTHSLQRAPIPTHSRQRMRAFPFSPIPVPGDSLILAHPLEPSPIPPLTAAAYADIAADASHISRQNHTDMCFHRSVG